MATEINYLKSICKVSRAFGSTFSKSKLLDLIVTSAIETMDAKAACLFLADKEEDVFIPVAQKGLSDQYLHAQPLHAKGIFGAYTDAVLPGQYTVEGGQVSTGSVMKSGGRIENSSTITTPP